MAEPTNQSQQYQIFFSSTNDPEVAKYRRSARAIIESDEFRDKWIAVEMDYFTPSTSSSSQRCRDLVLSCPVYVGILGPFYGSVDKQTDIGFTELEYNAAFEFHKRIAIFLLPDTVLSDSSPDIIQKQGALLQRQQDFIRQVNNKHMTRPVISLQDFEDHFRRFLTEFPPSQEDWSISPAVSTFFGRTEEMATLEQWIVDDRCRLISIIGLGGIGKTDLTLKFGHNVSSNFERVIWRSLLNAPTLTELLTDIIKFISDQQDIISAEVIDEQISRLIYYMQKRRCLIILDNVETILQGKEQAGLYQDDFETYGYFFKKIGEMSHQSCLLINSREKPRDIALQEGRTRPVRSLVLGGLNENDGKNIFEEIGQFTGTSEEWKKLVSLYNGNPFALELVAKHINEVFFGNISQFLVEGTPLFQDINDLLLWHFERLSDVEREVLYWLALHREPVSLLDLESDLIDSSSKQHLPSTLQLIQRRIPLEKIALRFTLQPILIEYLTDKIIDQAVNDISSGKILLLRSHALLFAFAKDYVRESQIRLILKPIQERLLSLVENQRELESRIDAILSTMRKEAPLEPSYAGGNLLNLLCQLTHELRGMDFSHLAIWQAYLQRVALYNTNFAFSDLKKCVFTQTFGPVSYLAFSPDGSLLAVSESNGRINIWRTSDYQIVLTLRAHISWVFALTFSPDGQILASGGEDKTVRLWDIRTGKCLHTLRGHTNSIWATAFFPQGRYIATGSEDETIRIWDLQSGESLRTLHGHDQKVFGLAFSSDGRILASSSSDRTVKVWDVENWSVIRVLNGHKEAVNGVAFSPDDRLIASAGWDGMICVWDVKTGENIQSFLDDGAKNLSVEFSPNGELIASSNGQGVVRIWNLYTERCQETLQKHVGEIMKVTFSRDGHLLASGDQDGIVRIWDTQDWTCLHAMQGYIDWVQAIALHPNGNLVVSTNADLSIRAWDLSTNLCIKIVPNAHTGWAFGIAFCPDGQRFVTCSDDLTIKIWDTSTWTCLNILKEHTNWIQTVAFSTNNQLLASGSDDRTIKIWNADSGECIQTLNGHTEGIWSVSFSADSRFVVSGSEDMTIKRWNIQTGQCLQTYTGHTDRIHSVAISPDESMIVSSSDDNTIRIWDIKTGKCISVLEGHTSWVISALFSPNGELIASGSKDQTVRLWKAQKRLWKRPLFVGHQVLQGHSEGVGCVTFGRDSKMVISASEDGSIRAWDTNSGKPLAVFRQPKPYEGLNILGVTGLTDAQKATLRILGAAEVEKLE